MSGKSEYPNTVEAAKKYVGYLAKNPYIEKVMLQGSRSPLRGRKVHKNSDWDFIAVTSVDELYFMRPRNLKMLHGDCIKIRPEQVDKLKFAVEVWPKDTHNILEVDNS